MRALTATRPDTAASEFVAALARALETARAEALPQPSISDLAAKPLLKLDEAAALTGLSRGILREAIDAGKLRSKMAGRARRIKREDLDAYLRKL